VQRTPLKKRSAGATRFHKISYQEEATATLESNPVVTEAEILFTNCTKGAEETGRPVADLLEITLKMALFLTLFGLVRRYFAEFALFLGDHQLHFLRHTSNWPANPRCR
jgi:hypothetical protein